MKINSESLGVSIQQKLEPLYCIFGAEILLIEQSLTQIRNVAKNKGYADRISFEVDGKFNWQKILEQISNTSLFSPKRIIELRLKSGKIGTKGSKTLTEIANALPPDILLIVITAKLDLAQQKSKWFSALEQKGCMVQHWEVPRARLAGWIANHMVQLGLKPNPEVAKNIAFYTEGNLLAAMQEIQKLHLAYPNGDIDTQSYQSQLNEQSRYTIYGLVDAALLGDEQQVIKIYHTLITEPTFAIGLSSLLYREIKNIVNIALDFQHNRQLDSILQKYNVWKKRYPIISSVVKRHPYQYLQKILLLLGRIDRSIKGVDNLATLDELKTLLLALAGKKQWIQ